MCQLLFERGELADAERAITELTRRDSQDASAYHNLGTVYSRMAKHKAAVQAYRESLRLRPNSPATHLQLGDALRDSGQIEEAISAWRQTLRLAPAIRRHSKHCDRYSNASARDPGCSSRW